MSQSSFDVLPLRAGLLDNLATLGYASMTPIQAAALPVVLAGRDVIAQAKTGSGKTAAFGLGLLNRLDESCFDVQCLVLCPTRELTDQVAREIRQLARTVPNIKVLTLTGGTPLGPQRTSLQHGAHIVVGTPGRVDDHLGKKTLSLDKVEMLVLDEADRMLDMGFADTLDKIIDQTPTQRQTLLFSATFPQAIQAIARRVMIEPEMIKVESVHDSSSIEQHFYRVGDDHQRQIALRLLLRQFEPESALVFCNTKRETQALADVLAKDGFSVLALHGDMDQKDRDQTLIRFTHRSASVLVATDVAARGLDINDLDAVFNYHIAHDPEVHVHRVGRTGRAGSQGLACSLFNEDEAHKVALLESELDPLRDSEALPDPDLLQRAPSPAPMSSIRIDSGKKQKLRPGDILGALTAPGGLEGRQVGKIHIASQWSFVAVDRSQAYKALKVLRQGKLKGRKARVWLLAESD